MGAMSRNKGSRGERELARLLSDELGVEVTRNLLQCRDSGHDLTGLPGWVLEVKRYKRVTDGLLREWWNQAHRQYADLVIGGLDESGSWPALAYRQDRGEWRVRVPLMAANPEVWGIYCGFVEETADISLPAFCQLVRESLEVPA